MLLAVINKQLQISVKPEGVALCWALQWVSKEKLPAQNDHNDECMKTSDYYISHNATKKT